MKCMHGIGGRAGHVVDLSGALWDEDTKTIVLEHDHYLGHTKDHPKDAEFLNRPIDFYKQMEIAFGSTMATGRYAMGSGEALGVFSGFGDSDAMKTEVDDLDDNQQRGVGAEKENTHAAEGSKTCEEATAGTKRKRSCFAEHEARILSNMTDAVNNVAAALRETGPAHVDEDLYGAVMNVSGFTEEALIVVFSHLLDNKAQGRGYINMSESHRVLWLRTWLAKHY